MELPEEDKEPVDQNRCGKLVMSMYGIRDAAINWFDEYTKILVKDGYKQGRANPCLFWHPSKKAAVMVHGDDFVAVGSDESLKSTRRTLEEKYKIKVQVLGPDEEQEIRVLNKIIRWTPEGIEFEADPRHAEIVIKELGLEGSKAIKVPGAKVRKEEQDDEKIEEQWQEVEELDADSITGL